MPIYFSERFAIESSPNDDSYKKYKGQLLIIPHIHSQALIRTWFDYNSFVLNAHSFPLPWWNTWWVSGYVSGYCAFFLYQHSSRYDFFFLSQTQ